MRITVRRSLAVGLACAAMAGMSIFVSQTAQATPSGTNGELAYISGGDLVLSNPDGSDATVLATGVTVDTPVWEPDGSAVIFAKGGDLWKISPDGSSLIQLTTGGHGDTDPAVAAYQGASRGAVTFIRDDQPYFVSDDGTGSAAAVDLADSPCGDENTDYVDYVPWDGPGAEAIVQRAAGLYLYTNDCPRTTQVNAVPGGSDPDWSPAGDQVIYLDSDADGVNQAFTAPYTDFKTTLGTATQLTHESSNVSAPRWSPDGTQFEYTVGGEIKVVNAASGATVSTIQDAEDGAWQPVAQGTVNRIYGADAVGAAIAASQHGFADTSGGDGARAQVVVLARSDEYYDAIAGAALARDLGGPLLVTQPASLDPAVLAEIRRVLGDSGTVYLLGGTASLSTGVQNALTAAGFTTDRIAGTDLFDTAALADQAMVAGGVDQITRVVLASGASYDDCLVASSAAAVAGNGTTAVVLTNGSTMPAASAAYLNTLNPATVQYITVGGPAAQALAGANLVWGPVTPAATLTGSDAIDTSVLVAGYFFRWGVSSLPNEVKVTGESSWADALAAGSLDGYPGSPLLLTSPVGGLTPEVQAFLEQDSGSINTVDDLASPSDLATSYDTQLGDAIGLPGQFTVTTINSSE